MSVILKMKTNFYSKFSKARLIWILSHKDLLQPSNAYRMEILFKLQVRKIININVII